MQFTNGKFTKSALGAGAAAVALLGVGGVAFAQGGAPDAPKADQTQQQGHHKHHGGKHHPLAGLEHGEFTKSTKQGAKTVDVQRGTVVAAAPNSLTVRSKDGFTATYTVDPTTKVRKQRGNAPITEVKPGDRVGVQADKNGAGAVARQVHDSGVPKPKPQQPTPNGQQNGGQNTQGGA
jgi:hypothetical protein